MEAGTCDVVAIDEIEILDPAPIALLPHRKSAEGKKRFEVQAGAGSGDRTRITSLEG